MKALPFSEPELPLLSEVGGKALSLMRMTKAGFAVPPGIALPVAFFVPWFDALSKTAAWSALATTGGNESELTAACSDLKRAAGDLVMTAAQRQALEVGLKQFESSTLFAVRSSSPEEDLDGSSFAGGYETVLGVTRETLEAAIKRAFASCLDVRVAVYKQAHGFEITQPRIAIVVQKQVASDVAGVGFSVDPLSNDHDIAVFNANWGLGETVVAGLASPDLYTVDKVSRTILGRQVGKKETSIWLTPTGGTRESADARSHELTLDDTQVLGLTDELTKIEDHYGRPMDIEWAFENGKLYILQARPITTHRTLPSGMMTEKGAKRHLYWDVTISVQGFFEPLTPMAEDCFRALLSGGSRAVLGKDVTVDPVRAPVLIRGGRMWLHLSPVMHIAPLSKIRDTLPLIDPVAAAALQTIEDETFYKSEQSPFDVPWGLLWIAPEKAAQLIEARLMPEHARQHVQEHVTRLLAKHDELDRANLPFDQLAHELVFATAKTMLAEILPYFVSAKLAMSHIRGIFDSPSDEESLHLSRLDQSLPGNVTVEMGLALASMASQLPQGATIESIEQGLKDGSLPDSFRRAWEEFVGRYGHRGPGEIDIANERYRDKPRMLISQLVGLAGTPDPNALPQAIYDKSQHERRAAYGALEALAKKRGWLSGQRLASLYKVVEALGGLRETPKFLMVLAIDRLRRRALLEADNLVANHRLDKPTDVFFLTFADLAEGISDPKLDLRSRARQRLAEQQQYRGKGELPRLIDSRGKILRPKPAKLKEGELGGHPISAGVVRGRVKVLHAPDEKPLLPGEILVARATDPGWTPLFVNAAAVVLEVGGVMQHGALVAREYGKACVAGIDSATQVLHDGELVEVDGSAGVVRRLEQNS